MRTNITLAAASFAQNCSAFDAIQLQYVTAQKRALVAAALQAFSAAALALAVLLV